MQVNKISANVSQQDRNEIMAMVARIKEKLPFLVSLTSEEIKDLSKMGDKGRTFSIKALEIVNQNPEIMPRGFDIEEFRRDMELFQTLDSISFALKQLTQLIDSTQILVGSDAYTSSRIVYEQVKSNHLGLALEEAATQLGRHFSRKIKQKPEEAK